MSKSNAVGTVDSNYADRYLKTLRSGDTNQIDNLFESGTAVEADATGDSAKNSKRINNIKQKVKAGETSPKAAKKAKNKAAKLNDGGKMAGKDVKKAKVNGNTVTVTLYTDKSHKKTETRTIQYGEDGSRIIKYKQNGKDVTKVIDKFGFLTEKTVTNPKKGTTTVTEYDGSGQPNKAVTTKADDPYYKSTEYYDDDGVLSYKVESDKNKTVTTTYKFDDNEQLVSSQETVTDKLTGKTTTTSELIDGKIKYKTIKDADGNVKTEMFSKNYRGEWENMYNGEIDGTFKQRGTGDCWLLSSIISLNSNPIGKQILNDSLQPNLDGSVTVTFRGVKDDDGKPMTYTVYPDEIMKNSHGEFSIGDKDALIFELATEKLRQDLQSGNEHVHLPDGLKCISGSAFHLADGKTPAQSGWSIESIYYITGVEGNQRRVSGTETLDPGVIHNIIDIYKSNPETSIVNFALGPGEHTASVIDDGENYVRTIRTGHAYAITDITGDTITFVDPRNSSETFTVTVDEFINMGIKGMSLVDLKDFNE